jgi:hypothetical protein
MPERNPHGDLAFATRKEFKEVMALLERAAAER